MDPTIALLSILGTIAVGAMSPGPSFVLVVRTSAALSRRDGLAAALGMGIGGLSFALLALAGLQALLMQVSWLYLILKLAGAAYLIYLGFRIWRGAAIPLAMSNDGQPAGNGWRKSFVIGLATQLSNPKTAIWYTSVFAAFLPADVPTWMLLVLPPLLFTHRVRLVHHRRFRLLRIEAARHLSRREAVDRSLCRRRGHAARRQADPRSGARPGRVERPHVKQIWQSWMIALARSPRVTRWMQGNRATASIARRFVAGADAAQAMTVARDLEQAGFTASLYYLGEYVKDPAIVAENGRQKIAVAEA